MGFWWFHSPLFPLIVGIGNPDFTIPSTGIFRMSGADPCTVFRPYPSDLILTEPSRFGDLIRSFTDGGTSSCHIPNFPPFPTDFAITYHDPHLLVELFAGTIGVCLKDGQLVSPRGPHRLSFQNRNSLSMAPSFELVKFVSLVSA